MDKVRAGTAREGALGYVRCDCVSFAHDLKNRGETPLPQNGCAARLFQFCTRFKNRRETRLPHVHNTLRLINTTQITGSGRIIYFISGIFVHFFLRYAGVEGITN